MMLKRFVHSAILASAVAAAASARLGHAEDRPNAPPPQSFDRLDEAAPEFSYRDATGRTHRLKDSLGQPLILHFWATWCTSCKVELPELAAAASGLSSRKIAVVTVAVDSEAQRPAVQHFLDGLKGTFPAMIVDKDDDAVKPYLTWGLPVTYVITASGKIVARALGPRTWTSLTEAQLTALLAR